MTKKLTLKLGRLASPTFAMAFHRLLQVRPMNVLDAYALNKTFRKLEGEQATYQKTVIKLMQDHGGKEDAGNWTLPKEAPGFLAFCTARQELDAQLLETELPRKIKLSAAQVTDLSALDLGELEELVEIES